MTQKISIWLAAMLTALFVVGCLGTGDPKEDLCITRPENIQEEVLNADYTGVPDEEIPFQIVDVEEIGNPELLKIVQDFMPDATQIAFTQRMFLKEEFRATKDISQVVWLTLSHLNPETGKQEVDVPAVVTTIGGIAGTFFPQIIPFLPLLGLFPWLARKRPRQHLGQAVKKAVPTDGTIDIVGAIASAAKAFGWDHSTKDPDELEKIAKKIRVETAAKNGELNTLSDALESKGK
jgi:hypothetical protein